MVRRAGGFNYGLEAGPASLPDMNATATIRNRVWQAAATQVRIQCVFSRAARAFAKVAATRYSTRNPQLSPGGKTSLAQSAPLRVTMPRGLAIRRKSQSQMTLANER